MIRLSKAHQEAIASHGASAFPFECCGVLIGELDGEVKVVTEVRPLPNTFEPDAEFERSVLPEGVEIALDPVGQERRYMVSPDTMFALMKEERRTQRKILGFYHSHPNNRAIPSAYDREWAAAWYTYIIVSVQRGVPTDQTAWRLNSDHTQFEAELIEVS